MGLARLKRLFGHASEYARLKLDLLEADIEQERTRLGGVLLRYTLITLCLLVGVQLLLAAVIALAWPTSWRIVVMIALSLLIFALAALQYRALRRFQAQTPPLQLRGDAERVPESTTTADPGSR